MQAKLILALSITTLTCHVQAWDIDFFNAPDCGGDVLKSSSGCEATCLLFPEGTQSIVTDFTAIGIVLETTDCSGDDAVYLGIGECYNLQALDQSVSLVDEREPCDEGFCSCP
jgi:hypothetical protein